MTKRVLVTGGAGFVGRHIVKRCLDLGYQVDCVDPIVALTGARDPAKGWPLYDPFDFQNFKYHKEDCRDYFEKNQNTFYDYAFHLAAIVGGRELIENDPLAVAVDLSIDSQYWRWAKGAKPAKTICFSSSAAYPIKFQRQGDYQLLKESMIDFSEDIGQPDMSYGWAKLTHEYLAKLAYEKHELKSITYRPFSGYGEDQDLNYPFPSICNRVIENNGASLINVWGTGDQMRDFIHIDDCVDMIFSTMDRIDDGSALNLSTGKYTSFKQFAALAAELYGYSPAVEGLSNKPAGVFARGGDTAKQKSFGCEAKISFADGIRRALKYFDNL